MENDEQAKMKRDQGLVTFMNDFKTIFVADVPMNVAFGQLKSCSAAEIISAAATEIDNTGFCADKLIAKHIACNMASVLGSVARVQFGLLGNQTLLNSIHGGVSYYFSVSDAICGARLQTAWNVLNNNSTILTVDYLTPDQLKNFQTVINTFVNLGGITTSANVASPAATAKFKSDLKKSSGTVVTIKDLGKNYKLLNLPFYIGLNNACKIPPINVHHTPVNFNLIDSVTGVVLEFVKCSLSRTKLSAISNALGVLSFKTVRAGIATAKFTLNDYVEGTSIVYIKRGVENNFTFKMVLEVIK